MCSYGPIVTTTGAVQVCTSNCSAAAPMLAFGNESINGITWNITVTTPAGGAGNVVLTQLVEATNTHILDPQGTLQTLTTSPAYVLDTDPQYQKSIQAWPASQQGSFDLDDTPGTTLSTSIKHQYDSEPFRTYLMYQPTRGIWVTLGSLPWSWSGAATKGTAGVWTLDAGSSHSTNPGGSNSTALPVWSSNITSFSYHENSHENCPGPITLV